MRFHRDGYSRLCIFTEIYFTFIDLGWFQTNLLILFLPNIRSKFGT